MMQNNYEEMLKHGWLPSSRTKLFSSRSSYHNGEEIDEHLLKSGTYSVQDLLAKKITTPLPPKAPASLGLSYLGYGSNPFQPNESWFSKGIGFLKGIQSEPSKLLNAGFAKQAGSIAVDFIPIVGNVKSGIEAIIGKDLITGEKLSTTDRLIAATGIVTGGLGKTALKGIKAGLGFAGVGRKVDKGTGNSSKWSSDKGIYSVAYEVNLPKDMYPNVSSPRHFQNANEQLYNAFQKDSIFAQQMEGLYPGINKGVQPGSRGKFSRNAPTKEVTWHHHADREGVLQLVPRNQHQAKGPIQQILHPGGRGGMENWGGGR